MRAFRFRIALLALGAVFGFGSGIRHLTHEYYYHSHSHRSHEHCFGGRDFGDSDDYDDRGDQRPSRAPSQKSGT
jgi:hypothetical protein